MKNTVFLCLFCVCLKCFPGNCIFLIIPEDVATGLAAVYGFSPKILTGNDNRLGFGFRFGNHADFQVMYEFGPQIYTKPIEPIRVRSASYRQRVVRRRPLLELLVRAGLVDLKETGYRFDVVGNGVDEPR